MASTINASTSPAAIVQTADGTGILALQTGNTTALTIDASQNVGIGTATPARMLDVSKTTGDASVAITSSTTGQSSLFFADTDINVGMIYYEHTNDAMGFRTNDAERMRIDSSGNLLVGLSSSPLSKVHFKGGNDNTMSIDNDGSRYTTAIWRNNGTYKSGVFYDNTDSKFYVQHNSGGVYLALNGTSWTSASDERSKDIIEPITDAINKVSTLRTVIGKYKTDEEGVRRSFLIAQDVQAVLPEAVNVQDDEQGTLGLAYTEVIPLLVASIKELKAIIDTQQEQINSLLGK